MFISLFSQTQTLDGIRGHATDGIRTWLTRFAPSLVPRRAGLAADDPSAASGMHRFVRDVITTDPRSSTRSPLVPIQIYLLEMALECVDWPALVHDRQLRRLDWSRATLVYPPAYADGAAGRSETGE
jgi:hypothetical protein